jgi:cobalt-zinc-cadmium resistance protein CzcA
MIRRLIHFTLHQPMFVALLTVIFIGSGIIAFQRLPIEAFPDVSDVQATVVTLYPGRAPEEVEKQVTIPLEVALSGLPHSVRLFSHTQFGLSYIVITFDDDVTDYFARQQVAERLQQVDLPPGVQPQLGPLSTAIGEIYRFRLKGAGWSSRDLRTLEDWVVERQLRMVPGVADITSMGGLIKTYEINPDLARLKYFNVTLQQLFTAVGRGNSNVGGSKLERGGQQYFIRGLGLLRSVDDIGNIVLTSHNGTPVLVKNVATVTISALPREGIVGQDAEPDIVNGIVLMRKGENPSDVLKALKERVALLNRSILPQGVQLVPYYDRTWLIDTTLHTVFHNLAEGAMLVTFVLLLFLGNLRAAAIVAVMIPLSLLGTFLGLTWRGIPANLLSLGAMDFGIIVDGAVIVVENVIRRLSLAGHHAGRDGLRHAIQEATAEVGRPTFYSMLIIIAAHLPIFTLQRQEGRIFAPMAWTVTSALIASLLFSLTVVPLLCYYLLGDRHHNKTAGSGWRRFGPVLAGIFAGRAGHREDNAVVRFCKGAYQPVLAWALNHRRLVIGAATLALLGSVALMPRLGTEFLPELNEGTIWINVDLPAGISVAEASYQCMRLQAALHSVPEVETVLPKAGRPEDGTDPKPINMVEAFVGLKPETQWRRGMTKDRLLKEMNRAVDAFPGLDIAFSQPIRDNVLESISQIDGQVVIKVFGEDPVTLRAKTEEMLHAVASVRGVARSFIDRAGQVPQSVIDIDRERAARYGLNVSDVEDVIETGLGGKAATELWEGEKHFSVLVRLPEAARGLELMRNILVDTPEGLHIPLAEVATFRESSGAMNISRENGSRVMAISIFIEGRDMGGVVADMQQQVKAIALPPGYVVTWSGEFENQQRAMKRLAVVVPVSVFLIFVLLFDAFKSVRSALLILMNVPFALIGGIVALYLTGIPLSVSAAIGFIALFGQSVLNGVVMVSYFNQLQDEGASAIEAVQRGALVRLRTVLMTALLAMLGLLPMALSHAIGSETQRPLAVVVIGGLITATLLTLVVLPVFYLLVNDHGQAAPGRENH